MIRLHMNEDKEKTIVARVAGISRHRIETDGPGIRTLVPFCGCRLDCAYCINGSLRSFKAGDPCEPDELLARVKIDDIYFRSSGGGITFGGGEPLLSTTFIHRFQEICPPEWSIAVETSLNVPSEDVEALIGVVDYWIIDIKDMDPERYLEYTGETNERVLPNLELLQRKVAPSAVRVRIPRIPGLNSDGDVEKSAGIIRAMGFGIESFEYVVPGHLLKDSMDILPGSIVAPHVTDPQKPDEGWAMRDRLADEINRIWLSGDGLQFD